MTDSSAELTLCMLKLKALIEQGNSPIFRVWEKIVPEARDWNSTAKNYQSAFEWSLQLTSHRPAGSKGFLYQNSLASCEQFTKSYSEQLFSQKAIISVSALGIILLLGIFWRIRYSRSA